MWHYVLGKKLRIYLLKLEAWVFLKVVHWKKYLGNITECLVEAIINFWFWYSIRWELQRHCLEYSYNIREILLSGIIIFAIDLKSICKIQKKVITIKKINNLLDFKKRHNFDEKFRFLIVHENIIETKILNVINYYHNYHTFLIDGDYSDTVKYSYNIIEILLNVIIIFAIDLKSICKIQKKFI